MAQGGLKVAAAIHQIVLARQAPAGFPLHKCSAVRHLGANKPGTSRNTAAIPLLQAKCCSPSIRNIGFHNSPLSSVLFKSTTPRTPSRSTFEAGQLRPSVTEAKLFPTVYGEFPPALTGPQQTKFYTSPATSQRRSYPLEVLGPFRVSGAAFASLVATPNPTHSAKTCGTARVGSSVGREGTGPVRALATTATDAAARATPSLTAGAGHVRVASVLGKTCEAITEGKSQEAAGEPCTPSASIGAIDLVRESYATAVGTWLLGCCGMVFGIVCWGGYTRLTKSGLSMTDWRFHGTWLPTSEKNWEEQFTKYKETPEYRDVHYGISLEEFKEIYFTEWIHRMLGRAAGALFLGGLLIFSAAGALSPRMIFRLTCLGALGGAQGLVGWWMVKSGFREPTTEVKTPRVSPYRLAAHLITAMTLYSLTLWQALSVLSGSRAAAKAAFALKSTGHSATATALRKFQIRLTAAGTVICTTLASGAFVAGNDAGRVYNTWPKMHDHWVPPEVHDVGHNWRKIFENLAVVQFNHRVLAYASIAVTGLIYLTCRALPLPPRLKKALILLPAATAFQALLGVATLLSCVPTGLGVLHQAGGMTVLTVLVYLLQTASRLRFHL